MLLLGRTNQSNHTILDTCEDRLAVHAEATGYEPSVLGSAIWRQLSALEMKPGEVAQLPSGAGTLVAHHASSLLVRNLYAKFWDLVKSIPGDILLANTVRLALAPHCYPACLKQCGGLQVQCLSLGVLALASQACCCTSCGSWQESRPRSSFTHGMPCSFSLGESLH